MANATVHNPLDAVAAQFGLSITPAMRSLIDDNDPRDPIAAQFIPSDAENNIQPDELADPISDETFSPVPGIVHRYPDRVLLKALHSCAVHCRFCFRREQINQGAHALDDAALDRAFAYVAQHFEIWEVILTGGDPMLLSPRRIADIVRRLDAIPHVKILRLHTRIPCVDPARVTPELVAALKGRAATYVLLHCNHARELTDAARAASARLIDAGIPMLSQSVLLRGVNDDSESLTALMRALVETRVKPHYLHHGDLARGTGHFRTTLAHGRELTRALRGHISGLCQPQYMLDIPGGHGKAPVSASFAHPDGDRWVIDDYRGGTHHYSDCVTEGAA